MVLKNSLPYQNNLLQGISNINFVFMGEKFASSWSFFSVLAGLAPVAPLPPDGFVLVRREGGLCGGFCACAALAAVLRRGVLAGRQGHSIFLSEISIVRYHYKMYTRAFSCKDTFSSSLRSPSLSISSSSLDPCILYELVLPNRISNAQSWSCTPIIMVWNVVRWKMQVAFSE